MGRKAQHRSALLRATQDLLRQKGYLAMGVADILRASGAPWGSLYHHFPESKVALAAEAVRVSGKTVRRHLMRLMQDHPTPEAFFSAYATRLEAWMAASNFRDGCPLATVMLETASEAPRLQAAGQAAFASWLAVFSAVFGRAGLGPVAAQAQALQSLAMIEGALLLSRVQQSTAPLATSMPACGRLPFDAA